MSDDANKSVLFVKKSDSKKGSLWNKLTNRRIIKQHGGFDIPEGDLHAIPKYHSPVEKEEASEEETKEALYDIEKEIKQLKEKDRNTKQPQFHEEKRQLTHEEPDSLDRDDDSY